MYNLHIFRGRIINLVRQAPMMPSSSPGESNYYPDSIVPELVLIAGCVVARVIGWFSWVEMMGR